MIQTKAQLVRYLKTINNTYRLAIDTEFKRISTYYPELCLVQIATTHSAECIDVLSIIDWNRYLKNSITVKPSGLFTQPDRTLNRSTTYQNDCQARYLILKLPPHY